MNTEQKQKIQALVEAEIRLSFKQIKEKADKKGKDIKAFYYFLVDDVFAANHGAITIQHMRKFDPEAAILAAIWSGECKIYEGVFTPANSESKDWLDKQSALYKETYQLLENIEDFEKREKIRADFEDCVINALKKCDEEGVFGNRAENGIVLFAFYIDDHDGNGENSLLFRSAKALNDDKKYQEAIDFTGC